MESKIHSLQNLYLYMYVCTHCDTLSNRNHDSLLYANIYSIKSGYYISKYDSSIKTYLHSLVLVFF